jgi:hypothetical protein
MNAISPQPGLSPSANKRQPALLTAVRPNPRGSGRARERWSLRRERPRRLGRDGLSASVPTASAGLCHQRQRHALSISPSAHNRA